MGIIRNHLLQMKIENPKEYTRLMDGYASEDEFVQEALGLSLKAINLYQAEGTNNGSKRFNTGSIRGTK